MGEGRAGVRVCHWQGQCDRSGTRLAFEAAGSSPSWGSAHTPGTSILSEGHALAPGALQTHTPRGTYQTQGDVCSAFGKMNLGPRDTRKEGAFIRFLAKLLSPTEDPVHPFQQGIPPFASEQAQLTDAGAPKGRVSSPEQLKLLARTPPSTAGWTPGHPPTPSPRSSDRFPVDYALIRVGRAASQVYRIRIVLPLLLPTRVRPRGLSGNNQALFTMDV